MSEAGEEALSQSSLSDLYGDDDDEEGSLKPVGTFRYLNIADTPCYRNTLLYSMTAALSTGLLQFMFTSNVQRSVRTTLWTWPATMCIYYTYCRHTNATNRFKFQRIKQKVIEYVDQKGKEEEEND